MSGKNKELKLGTKVSAVPRGERALALLPKCANERDCHIEDSGVYCLVLRLAKACRITAGALGSRRLTAGWYVYTGSAKHHLAARLDRHIRRAKRIHWHIDALRAAASVYCIRIRPWGEGVECGTNTMIQALPGAAIPWKGFGSSDCRCESHLTAFDEMPEAVLAWSDRFGRDISRFRSRGALVDPSHDPLLRFDQMVEPAYTFSVRRGAARKRSCRDNT